MVKYQYLLLWNVLTFTFSFTSANPWDPKPRTDGWGKQKHEEFIASSKKNSASIKVVFYGESLVEEFSSTGNDVWLKYYSNLHSVNYGIGGDNCENVIWRIQEAEVDGLNVEVVVLMIGTTNLPFSSAKDIAKGIKTIVDLLLEKMPHTKVLLLGVLPRQDKDYKDKIKELNSDLSTFDNGKNIRFLDMTSHFSDAGHINKEMYNTDGFHLSKGGYIAWAETMDPLLHKMIGKSYSIIRFLIVLMR
jgi:beta-glucosidase